MQAAMLPVFLFTVCVAALAVALLVLGNVFSPRRPTPVKRMPYESGMNPIHDTRRRFDVRFHLLAIAFLVFDVELLFLYPWAVAFRPAAVEFSAADGAAAPAMRAVPDPGPDFAGTAASPARPPLIFAGGMVFVGLLVLGFVYDWRKGIFRWR
jgi:NADH-quinone oxidoreductase subunit A